MAGKVTSIRINPDLIERLDALAKKEGRRKAAIINDALRIYLNDRDLARLITKGAPGPGDDNEVLRKLMAGERVLTSPLLALGNGAQGRRDAIQIATLTARMDRMEELLRLLAGAAREPGTDGYRIVHADGREWTNEELDELSIPTKDGAVSVEGVAAGPLGKAILLHSTDGSAWCFAQYVTDDMAISWDR